MQKINTFEDYGYSKLDNKIFTRPEYKHIMNMVDANSKILDLGCGDGSLGYLLIKNKKCSVYGIEIDKNGVKLAKEKGVLAKEGSIDKGLNYKNKTFDYVIINVTIQMVYDPDTLVKEALRVGKKVIVSFPNFSNILCRLQSLTGRFPKFCLYGYEWYNTRHIHLFSYKDFIEYCKKRNIKIVDKHFLSWNSVDTNFLSNLFPNLLSMVPIIMIEGGKNG